MAGSNLTKRSTELPNRRGTRRAKPIAEKKLSPADAYTLASIACDFHIAESVDLTQVVVGKVPKAVFR